jgi:hypothetical protein
LFHFAIKLSGSSVSQEIPADQTFLRMILALRMIGASIPKGSKIDEIARRRSRLVTTVELILKPNLNESSLQFYNSPSVFSVGNSSKLVLGRYGSQEEYYQGLDGMMLSISEGEIPPDLAKSSVVLNV